MSELSTSVPLKSSHPEPFSSKLDLSIIIVNWNTRYVLEPCLEAIFRHPPSQYSFEVIVVDNASSDNSVSWLQQNFPQVRIIADQKNFGFARAVNQAYRISRGRYVISLNPDVEVTEGNFDKIANFLDEHRDVGLLAPSLLESRLGEGSHILVHENPPNKIPLFLLSRIKVLFRKESQTSIKSHELSEFVAGNYIEGPCMVCRREALERDRIFSEETFLYNEEFPLCESIRQKGYRIGVLKTAYVRHLGSSSYRKSLEQTYAVRLEALRGWYHFHKRRIPLFSLRLHAVAQLFDALVAFGVLWVVYFALGRRNPDRASALGYHKSRLVGFFWILLWPPMLDRIARKKVTTILGGQF